MGACGSCFGSNTSPGEGQNQVHYKKNGGTALYRAKVEIYSLSSDDESLKWIPFLLGETQISLECLQEGEIYVYHVCSTSKKFSTKIYIPGTQLRQTSEKFVQWKAWDDAGAWGLNFTTETEATRFLDACAPPSLTPQNARLRHAFSTLSLTIPLPPGAGISYIERHNTPANVNSYVIDTTTVDVPSNRTVSPVEDHAERTADLEPVEGTGMVTSEEPGKDRTLEDRQVIPLEYSDEYISGVLNSGTVNSVTRRSILFTEDYISQSASLEDGPNLPSTPPPGPLISPCLRSSTAISSPRLSWLFTSSTPEGVSFSELSLSPPELPLSPPPGKTLSPRPSSSALNIPSDLSHLANIPLYRLPLAEIVVHELDETEDDSNVSQTATNDTDEKLTNDNLELSPNTDHPLLQIRTAEEKEEYVAPHRSGTLTRQDAAHIVDSGLTRQDAVHVVDSGVDTEAEHNDKRQFTKATSPSDLESEIHSTIESFMSSSTLATNLDQPNRRESSSTAPTEISNTSEETQHAKNTIPRSNSTNSLNSTESEDDGIGKSTTMTQDASSDPVRTRAFSDTHVPSDMESKHIAKAGVLEMKRILVHRNRVIAMASKKRWKKYWAKLRGSTLLLSLCENVTSVSDEVPVSLKIDMEGAIAHPEHMKRDNVVYLSTSVGDAYYFQTTSQAEVETWIRAIHSVAAISITKQLIKEESITTLQTRLKQIEEMIVSENKLKKLAELQLSVSDPTSKAVINSELQAWSENIERLHVEQYRHRCYMASLQGTELPNPQSLLANVLKSTKIFLVKLGTFSAASVHAKVCARHGGMLVNLGGLQTKKPIGSPIKLSGSVNLAGSLRWRMGSKKKSGTLPRSKTQISRPFLFGGEYDVFGQDQSLMPGQAREKDDTSIIEVSEGNPVWAGLASFVRVKMPDDQSVAVGTDNAITVDELLQRSCEKGGLDHEDYFIQLKRTTDNDELETAIPVPEDLLSEWEYLYVEVIQKLVYPLRLDKSAKYMHFGMIVAPKCTDNNVIHRVIIEKVISGGPAETYGVIEGDEILAINEKQVLGMKPITLQHHLRDETILLTLKSSSTEVPYSFKEETATVINDLMLPAPPEQALLTEDSLQQLIIPNPPDYDGQNSDWYDGVLGDSVFLQEVDTLLKDSDELNRFVHSMKEYAEDELDDSRPRRHLTTEEKLCKCLLELLETEQEYIKDLNKLVSRYLIPLKAESFITPIELTVLFGNILEITKFQNKFLEHLEAILEDISSTTHHENLQGDRVRRIIFSVAGTFIFFIDHFRLYSTFCASHCQAQEVLRQAHNKALQEFLAARNPKNEHSLTLESLLIKPIQRVLRYPLFLKAMKDLTPSNSDEQDHLKEAIKGMDRVADYINEMQRIHDQHSSLFNKLMNQHNKEGLNLSIGQLLHKCEVMWLNAPDEVSKGWRKKGHGPEVLCFVFMSAIVITVEKKRTRKTSKATLLETEESKFSVAIPLEQFSVFDLPDSDGVTGMWQLVQRDHCHDVRPVRYLFRSEETEKYEILQIIREKSINHDITQL